MELDIKPLNELRTKLFDAIAKKLEIDGHSKGYEGTFSIVFPGYFDHGNNWILKLDCYIIGPSRHYSWSGKTFQEAFQAAEKEIMGWIDSSNKEYEEYIKDPQKFYDNWNQ